jgi:hypothetical protein
MSKLYVFGIGGTGSRVLRSLTMLLSAGVECGVDTIVPIIIDRDKGNGDYTRTYNLIEKYIQVNSVAPKKKKNKNITNRFFNTEIKLLSGDQLMLKLNDQSRKFKDFIGYSTQTEANKALSKMLFSENTLEMDIEYGFRGNPNIGSVVLNQLNDQDVFKSFASDFKKDDKIFIISSIFGGTGASGFPLLRKMLQTPNVNDADGNALPNWGLINKAPIGAISVLPYFNVNKNVSVDSDTFNDKARAALSYYETEDGKLDTLYYIADARRKTYEYAEGGEQQKNNAHFVELAAAMSILDFVNPQKESENFIRDGAGRRRTVYKEFGISSDAKEISFADLAAETQKLLVNPLSRFMLFAKYMGHTIVEKNENGRDIFVADDIFDKESKYQPYAHGRFVGDFRNKISALETVQDLFLDWLQEMTQQDRNFSPFNLKTPDPFSFVNGKISLFKNKDFKYKNWAKVDNELNRLIAGINSSLTDIEKFIELFYRATEALIDQTTPNNGGGDQKYIFRLQNEGDFGLMNTIEHWGVSQMYGERQRNAISSSNVNSDSQPTSIPSPFARIALVKTALSEVATHREQALRAYQKIVSDTLDVAEIFFTLDKWKSRNVIEVITWDKTKNLEELSRHQPILHKTLNSFLIDDAEVYNFDRMNCIYILKHTATGEMIGATSPSTLFFPSPNTLDLSRINIQLSTHKAFDGIKPLHERGWRFQKYLYTWLEANNEVRPTTPTQSIFNEVLQYFVAEKNISIDNQVREARDFENGDLTQYVPLQSPQIEILGDKCWHQLKFNWYKLNLNDLEGGAREYIEGAREYLSSEDLLESKIIRRDGTPHKEDFFDGNLPPGCEYTYLLPIKENFFQYYTINELKIIDELNPPIRIEHYNNYAKVTLEIGGRKYEKEYKKSDDNIVEQSDFDYMLFPNVKFTRDEDACYRFAMFLPSPSRIKNSVDNYSVDFYKGRTRVAAEMPVVRNTNDEENSICKIYPLNQKSFDRMTIKINGVSGMLFPNLPDKGSTENFTFAVDFGTTNTHIEYKTDTKQTIRPFDIQQNDKQISFLCGDLLPHTLVSDIDFIPSLIGRDAPFKFPIRTALSMQKNLEKPEKILPFVQANIIIPYEKRKIPQYNRVLTQLKWDSTEDEMGYYIDSLCFVLRNKVVLNGGNLQQTKIVWFYPLSMAGSRSNIIRDKWQLAYSKYFLGIDVTNVNDLEENQRKILNSNIIELSESVAPFLYYKEESNYRDVLNNLVCIDIGGGTTDIAFITDGNHMPFATSFRFAANSIFGLGNHITPIVRKHQPTIEGIILDKKRGNNEVRYNYDFDNIYDGIKGDTQKGDIASFFFGLKNHEKLHNVNIDFNSMLKKDNEQKLVFVLFYAAIIYHAAQIMKAKNLGLPRHLAFSGNGSRIVNIVGDKDILAAFSKSIFEKVYSQRYHTKGCPDNLEIIQDAPNPKEITCKGGIKAADNNYRQEAFTPVVLLGTDDTTFAENMTYSSIRIEDSVTTTNHQVIQFVNYVITELMQQKYTGGVVEETFARAMNIEQQTLQIVQEVLDNQEDLANFTRKGINDKIESIGNPSTRIEETFFFYPITSLLNAISKAINERVR